MQARALFFLKKDVCRANGHPRVFANFRRMQFVLRIIRNIVSYFDFIGIFSPSYHPFKHLYREPDWEIFYWKKYAIVCIYEFFFVPLRRFCKNGI